MAAKKTERISSQPWQVTPITGNIGKQFESIFIEHWPRVHGFLQNLVGDHDEAEDLALETFMRLYKNPAVLEPEVNVGGWLHRVAIHLGMNAIRGRKRREHYELDATQNEKLNHAETNPAELMVSKEEQNRTRQVLGEMNPRQAQLLVMRYSGMSYREIASALSLAVTSIGPLLVRAEDVFERRYRANATKEEDYAPR